MQPRMHYLSIQSSWEQQSSSGVAIDQKMTDTLMKLLKQCSHTLQILDIVESSASLIELPPLPSLRHLHLKLHDLDCFPQNWLAGADLRSIEITLAGPRAETLSGKEAAFVERFTTERTRVSIGGIRRTLVDGYSWENLSFDPVLGCLGNET